MASSSTNTSNSTKDAVQKSTKTPNETAKNSTAPTPESKEKIIQQINKHTMPTEEESDQMLFRHVPGRRLLADIRGNADYEESYREMSFRPPAMASMIVRARPYEEIKMPDTTSDVPPGSTTKPGDHN